jgi:hypothetical protein
MINHEDVYATIKTNLTNSLTELFKCISNEIKDVLDDLEEPTSEYLISLYPFSIERIDGNPVPEKVLKGIQEKMKASLKN